jgi:D-alanyl-lipoteichoic acid acyltransferase DltB (MBOAT superfamily)
MAWPAGRARTTVFGLVNCVAVLGLLGAAALGALAALAVMLWIGLSCFRWLQSAGRRRASYAVLVALYASAAMPFVFYKVFFDAVVPPAQGSSAPWVAVTHLFRLVAFSYVFLRLVDAIRAGAAGAPILDPLSLAGYIAPFFMIPAGPINSYAEHAKMNSTEPLQPTIASFVAAADVVTTGLFLRLVVAEGLRLLVVGVNGSWPMRSFVDSAIILIYVYFDFWGYSLIALGVGQLLGVPTPANFNRPFRSQSVTEFWTRWHISLGDVVRRTFFVPIQVTLVRRFGQRWAYSTNLAALTVTFVFVGVWHRFSLPFVLWGVGVGAVVAAEKIVRDALRGRMRRGHWIERVQPILGPMYVFVVIVGTLHVAIAELMKAAQ